MSSPFKTLGPVNQTYLKQVFKSNFMGAEFDSNVTRKCTKKDSPGFTICRRCIKVEVNTFNCTISCWI